MSGNCAPFWARRPLFASACEEVARQAREALEKVAEALCPDAVDRFRQANPAGLAVLAPDELARLVISEVGARMRRLEVAGGAGQDLAARWKRPRGRRSGRGRKSPASGELEAERAARQAAETRAAALERMSEANFRSRTTASAPVLGRGDQRRGRSKGSGPSPTCNPPGAPPSLGAGVGQGPVV